MKRKIIKLIDYPFQHSWQLVGARDDSNSVHGLSEDLDIEIIGRLERPLLENQMVVDNGFPLERHLVPGNPYYLVSFFDRRINPKYIADYIVSKNPDVIHMHGTTAWPQYLFYANFFKEHLKAKMIFSPAGSCRGPREFLECFDVVIVNHPIQINLMKCDEKRIIVRRRTADPSIFMKFDLPKRFDLVYIAGFVPVKRIDVMMNLVANTDLSLVILGDIERKRDHYESIKNMIDKNPENFKNITLHNFILQSKLSEFLGQCRMFVWPNIRPENLGTVTNRSIVEALACGMPLLLGERAFNQTEYVINGFNGYKYSGINDFIQKAKWILKSPKTYSNNSLKLYSDQFSFKKNFIDFYNELYL